MNKRANTEEVIIFLILSIVCIGAILFSLSYYTNQITKDTFFKKEYLAKDTAFLLDAIYSSPQDIEVIYSLNENYNFYLIEKEGTSFILVKLSEKDQIETKFWYNKNYQLKLKDSEPESTNSLLFINKDGEISIEKNE